MSITITIIRLLLVYCAIFFIVLLAIGLVELLCPGILPGFFKKPVSKVLNVWVHVREKRDGIPSCPYVWPNGQGDSSKFLGGVENSIAWGNQYGDTYRIWSGMKPEIVLTQPHQLYAVFRDSDKHCKAPANNSGFYMSRLLGQCVGLISGSEWRAVRAVAEIPFGHRAVALQFDNFQRQVLGHFEALHASKGVDDSNLNRGFLHPVDDLAMLPFRIVADMFYGQLSPELRMLLEDMVPLRTRIFNTHVIGGGLHRFAWSRFLPTAANAELKRFKREWKGFNRRVLEHAQQEKGTLPPIVDMYGAVASQNLSEEQLLQTLDESLFANLDVTIGGLSWIPVFLAADKDVQRRLRTEIETQASLGADAFRRYLLNGSSTYLACCVLESSRLRPLAAFSVPQAAPTPRRIDVTSGPGFVVPAGTSFVVDTYALNVRSGAWAPDNESFRPERFMNRAAKNSLDRRYLFWRFGFGPRQCMGRHAADLIIRMTVAYLVRNYDLDLVSVDDHPGDAHWARSQTCWITHPDFKLKCTRRHSDSS
ncbi:cytochrome P450 [Colletotrichum sublineola]|nr:cytochrome P450 [Colletotrichum sublineola]